LYAGGLGGLGNGPAYGVQISGQIDHWVTPDGSHKWRRPRWNGA
jgi:hypothetical protein